MAGLLNIIYRMKRRRKHAEVWIVGSEGQIGDAINEVLDPLEIEVLNTDKNALDITETDEVLHFGEINRPDVIINCAAITDVELCEKQPEEAFRVNALGARNLSLVARKTGQRWCSFPQTTFLTVWHRSRTRSLTIQTLRLFTENPSAPGRIM